MDAIAILLRFLHIGAGITWVGSAFFVLAVLDPMAVRIGAVEAHRIHRHLVLRSKFGALFPIAGITTVVAGFVLYWRVHAQDAWPMSTSAGIVFHVGVLFGVLALVWGGAMEGRLLGKVRKLSTAMEGGKPTAAQETEFTGLVHRLSNANKVSGVLLVIAMFGMATFQYF
ncbi:MAG TPA: hypothetical protein VM286_04120 [Candidatus Thermoplasmatota archaeon]|nr:hypothetical protein [Candidatus Thermoplasmatota archaeon]